VDGGHNGTLGLPIQRNPAVAWRCDSTSVSTLLCPWFGPGNSPGVVGDFRIYSDNLGNSIDILVLLCVEANGLCIRDFDVLLPWKPDVCDLGARVSLRARDII